MEYDDDEREFSDESISVSRGDKVKEKEGVEAGGKIA